MGRIFSRAIAEGLLNFRFLFSNGTCDQERAYITRLRNVNHLRSFVFRGKFIPHTSAGHATKGPSKGWWIFSIRFQGQFISRFRAFSKAFPWVSGGLLSLILL